MRRFLGILLIAAACEAEEPRLQAVSPLSDTRDTGGPYSVTVVATGVTDEDTVEVFYRSTASAIPGQVIGVTAQEGARDDLFVASIPGHPAGTMIEYFAVTKRGDVTFLTPPDLPTIEVPWSFRVLAPSGFCRADSDCQLGLEICAAGTCRAYEGICVVTPSGLSCPGGYACDTERDPDVCVIAPHPCANDSQCPTVEECDPGRDQCVARTPCADPSECPTGYECSETLGLCFRD